MEEHKSALAHSEMLVGVAAGLSTVLPSSTDAARDMTIAKSLAGPHGLRVGLVWWGIGMLLALLSS